MTSGPRGHVWGYAWGKGQVIVTRVHCLETCGHWGGPARLRVQEEWGLTCNLQRVAVPGMRHQRQQDPDSHHAARVAGLVPHPSTRSPSPLTDPALDAPAASWWGVFSGPSAPQTWGRIHYLPYCGCRRALLTCRDLRTTGVSPVDPTGGKTSLLLSPLCAWLCMCRHA